MKKQLGFFDVFAICSGSMISSGLFILPALAAAKVGPMVIAAYALSGVLLIPAMFSTAEMATAMPRMGGTYFFISRILGGMFGTLDWEYITDLIAKTDYELPLTLETVMYEGEFHATFFKRNKFVGDRLHEMVVSKRQ